MYSSVSSNKTIKVSEAKFCSDKTLLFKAFSLKLHFY